MDPPPPPESSSSSLTRRSRASCAPYMPTTTLTITGSPFPALTSTAIHESACAYARVRLVLLICNTVVVVAVSTGNLYYAQCTSCSAPRPRRRRTYYYTTVVIASTGRYPGQNTKSPLRCQVMKVAATGWVREGDHAQVENEGLTMRVRHLGNGAASAAATVGGVVVDGDLLGLLGDGGSDVEKRVHLCS
ncbi:uncharacterized protein C8Q71DRAFT_564726 [Rhodofomes roseus]|uniref:Uncharacterized protein n=1 Tax=Rhodofomes roseus TaxID=34475 RepID=A0ABQ8KK28_9APHY|nr:uncharacterized protein C8Q71DRAFT_564726 [Rhodofomes roseus]KAH9837848.1 hypothetical protein C8Q71DRAFT_564726 [Rhodofomes roseus]